MKIDYERLNKNFKTSFEDQKRRETIEHKMIALEARLKHFRKQQNVKSRPRISSSSRKFEYLINFYRKRRSQEDSRRYYKMSDEEVHQRY